MGNDIIIVGAFHEVIELAEEAGVRIAGLIDNVKKDSYRDYPILGNDSDAISLSLLQRKTPIVITPDLPEIRAKLFDFYEKSGFTFSSLVSPNANISKTAAIGIGTIIQSGVNVSSEVRVGKFVKLNTACNVMHNTIVDNFTTVAPNAVILGNVSIGEFCYIGANATILPNIKICNNVVIGAGAVVTKNISERGKYAGVPARKI
jgi:sugar O-acyltransferase (sialic acid O-acetyltransferase NeuD family)